VSARAVRDRQLALADLVHVIRHFRQIADSKPLIQGSDYAHAVQELNKAIDRAEALLHDCPCADDIEESHQKKSLAAATTPGYHQSETIAPQ
jgi:hypothetical protein